MTKELKLSTDQQASVKAILEDQNTKMQDMRKDAGDKGKAVHEETHAKLVAVLNEDQKTKFEEIRNSTTDEIRKILNPDQKIKFEINPDLARSNGLTIGGILLDLAIKN